MIILGLDPASVKFGYGVVRASGAELTFVDAGVLTAPAAWDKYRRLAEIGRDLEALFTEHAIDAVAIEAGFVHGQMGALTSGAARGVGGYLAARRGIPVFEYAPASIKKCITGSGAADKEAVARIVQLRLKMVRQPEPDAGDALGAAVCHAHHILARPVAEAA